MNPILNFMLRSIIGGLLGLFVYVVVGWHWYTLPIALLVGLAHGIVCGLVVPTRRRT